MADKSSQLVLGALTRAAADAAGVPLHGNKAIPGLFPTTAVGKQAAQRCCDEGYLASVENPSPGRASPGPVCVITEKGLSYLLGQVNPREVLEDFVRVLEAREAQVRQLLDVARDMKAGIEALETNVTAVLARIGPPGGDLKTLFQDFRKEMPPAPTPASPPNPVVGIRLAMSNWASSSVGEDQPLPDLYRRVQSTCPGLTIGDFHDALRDMVRDNEIYLHPWTGPLYEIPEPSFALLIGHEVGYYASLRQG